MHILKLSVVIVHNEMLTSWNDAKDKNACKSKNGVASKTW